MRLIGTTCIPLYTSSFGLRSFLMSVKEISVASSGLSKCCISFTSALLWALLKSSSVCDNRYCETKFVSLLCCCLGYYINDYMAVGVDNGCFFTHRQAGCR